jgi:hypothetical protein
VPSFCQTQTPSQPHLCRSQRAPWSWQPAPHMAAAHILSNMLD